MKITKFTVIRSDETRDKGHIFNEGNSLKSKSLTVNFISFTIFCLDLDTNN